jgi:hypothetical protein
MKWRLKESHEIKSYKDSINDDLYLVFRRLSIPGLLISSHEWGLMVTP